MRATQHAIRNTHHASRITFYVLLITLLFSACAPSDNSAPQPPDIAYGRDLCDACGMIISDAKFAAATVLADGETRKFDDIGDMFGYHGDHPEHQVRAWFVHDHDTEKWLRGEKAFYVVGPNIQSPMGHGIVAFAEKAAAETFAAGLGVNALTFDEARAAAHMEMHGR